MLARPKTKRKRAIKERKARSLEKYFSINWICFWRCFREKLFVLLLGHALNRKFMHLGQGQVSWQDPSLFIFITYKSVTRHKNVWRFVLEMHRNSPFKWISYNVIFLPFVTQQNLSLHSYVNSLFLLTFWWWKLKFNYIREKLLTSF